MCWIFTNNSFTKHQGVSLFQPGIQNGGPRHFAETQFAECKICRYDIWTNWNIAKCDSLTSVNVAETCRKLTEVGRNYKVIGNRGNLRIQYMTVHVVLIMFQATVYSTCACCF